MGLVLLLAILHLCAVLKGKFYHEVGMRILPQWLHVSRFKNVLKFVRGFNFVFSPIQRFVICKNMLVTRPYPVTAGSYLKGVLFHH